MAKANPKGSRFIVDLGSIKLPPVLEKQVETDIRSVVLRALAEQDFVRSRRLQGSIFDKFPGRTLGLWIDPDHPEMGSWEDTVPLSARDHTAIVDAVMTYPMQVLKYLDWKNSEPSQVEILEAALKVQQIDDDVKRRISAAIDVLSMLESGSVTTRRSGLSSTALKKQLSGRSIDEQIRRLTDGDSRLRKDEGTAEVLDSVALMLEDGRDSIYSTDHPFYGIIAEGADDPEAVARDTVDNVKDADAIGGALGGGAGLIVAGVGAGPGAAAGAAGASVGAIVGSVIAWLTD